MAFQLKHKKASNQRYNPGCKKALVKDFASFATPESWRA
jgi:hypothetical protein